jgi:hypothetical protein
LMVEANIQEALSKGLKLYIDGMERGEKYLDPTDFETEHKRLLDEAIECFDSRKKMGGQNTSAIKKKEVIHFFLT